MVTRHFGASFLCAVSLVFACAFAQGCAQADMANAAHDTSSPGVSAKSAASSPRAMAPTGGVRVDLTQTSDGAANMGRNAPGHLASVPMVMRQVIRKAELDVRVDNVEKAEKAVNHIVEEDGGYTESASSTDLASAHPELNISLRVPVGAFDTTIARFEALGVRLSKKIESEDVTSHIVDLDARLKTLSAQELVYRNMLKNRTQLEEVFNIQSQLTEVRTQIETIAAERKTQSGLAAMSTISLTLEQSAVASQAPSDPNWLAQTWGEASSGASVAFRVVVVGAVWLLAFSPFLIVAFFVAHRALRRRPPVEV